MGFRPVARHRSREVLLYRQGPMNVIINAHAGAGSHAQPLPEVPAIAAIALRVRDAAAAHARALELGAWDVPVRVAPVDEWLAVSRRQLAAVREALVAAGR